IEEKLPTARKKRATVNITLAAAVLLDPQGRTLLVRQADSDGDLFSHMWQFPALEISGTGGGRALAAFLHKKFQLDLPATPKPLAAARHTVTFRNIRLETYLIRIPRLPRKKGFRIDMLAHVPDVSISNATRKIARVAIEEVQPAAAKGSQSRRDARS
ncbi:MAG TPA: hypothetical protein VGI34_05240, partial [Candidatus Acidoferrales bacterium]